MIGEVSDDWWWLIFCFKNLQLIFWGVAGLVIILELLIILEIVILSFFFSVFLYFIVHVWKRVPSVWCINVFWMNWFYNNTRFWVSPKFKVADYTWNCSFEFLLSCSFYFVLYMCGQEFLVYDALMYFGYIDFIVTRGFGIFGFMVNIRFLCSHRGKSEGL